MNRIPLQLIKDYGIVCLFYIAILLFLRPAFFGEYKITDSLMVVAVVHTVVLFLSLCMSECIVTFFLRMPFSYADAFVTRFQHFVFCGGLCVPLLMVLLTQANAIMIHGVEHADYAWIDEGGKFTLEWMLMLRLPCAIASFTVAIAMTVLSEIHQMRYVLQELLQINQLLEVEQQSFPSFQSKENEEDEITLHSENRDSLVLRPQDIVYVESVGNYANVCYIGNEQLTETTIRTTIKQLKEDLLGNNFIVQCHRGFLVNLEYVESMDSSSGRFSLNMFYSDKKIPVSRANKSAIRDALTALQFK